MASCLDSDRVLPKKRRIKLNPLSNKSPVKKLSTTNQRKHSHRSNKKAKTPFNRDVQRLMPTGM